MWTAKTLIRLGGCPGWSESPLGVQAILLVLSWDGSNLSQECYVYHSWIGFIRINMESNNQDTKTGHFFFILLNNEKIFRHGLRTSSDDWKNLIKFFNLDSYHPQGSNICLAYWHLNTIFFINDFPVSYSTRPRYNKNVFYSIKEREKSIISKLGRQDYQGILQNYEPAHEIMVLIT